MNFLKHVDVQMDVSNSLPSTSLNDKIFLSGYIGMTFAIATTVLRIALRISYFGWDDAFAGVALLSLILTVVAGKIYFGIGASSTIPQSSRVALYYILAVNFDITVWIARLSILFTIIRLGLYRKQLYVAAGGFVLAMLILVAQVFWVCEFRNRQDHWKEEPFPQCIGEESITITQVTSLVSLLFNSYQHPDYGFLCPADAFADIVLVASPLFLLRHLKSKDTKSLRLRLSASFIVGGLTTFVSIVRAVFALDGNQISLLVTNVEVCVSVTMANFTVLVAAVFRLWKTVCSHSINNRQEMAEPKLPSMVFSAPPSDPEYGLTLNPGSSTSWNEV
ncbi:hypothetical protein GYMLUDRAFT_55777 [Collybiopsis luxurians FD-317 M1]|nr:hypothetical protein GYMLUDRAFT_55777 [Collybiopsis luxurians FD-317 M1]